MSDPINAISSLAGAAKAIDPMAGETAKASAALWLKVLGPPAEAIGTHLKARVDQWSEDALARRVLKRAVKKINASEEGTVPPRVASDIFDKAQWADDEFVAEYLSGVLASARTQDGKDDSGVSWTALVGRMSSTQLRLHYILYSTARHHLLGHQIELTNELEELAIYIPLLPVLEALDMGERSGDAFNEAIANLVREGLIHRRYVINTTADRLAPGKSLPEQHAMVYRLSPVGIMLYLRGGGSRMTRVRAIADPETTISYDDVGGLATPIAGSGLLSGMPDAT